MRGWHRLTNQWTVDDYLSTGYIQDVPEDEPKPPSEWFLPHFPVVRPEKATTKVRVVSRF